MPTADIYITDQDRNVGYQLTVDYDFSPVRRSFWDRIFRLLEPDCLEISKVVCTSTVLWCGDYGVPGDPDDCKAERNVGAWCWQRYEELIEQAIEDHVYAKHGDDE